MSVSAQGPSSDPYATPAEPTAPTVRYEYRFKFNPASDTESSSPWSQHYPGPDEITDWTENFSSFCVERRMVMEFEPQTVIRYNEGHA